MPPSSAPLNAETLKRLFQTMLRIRRFDERTVELFNEGLVKGTAHSYVGQEAVATAACAHLTNDDSVISNHRGHGHCIAKGARLELMMAELMGREPGYCRGLGGSMHIAALDLNMLGANGIVAAGVPIGAGAALANTLRKRDRVVISFFGDGGANQGTVHETMNLAAVWKLPFIFVCENNKYALSTEQSRTTAGEGVTARARAYAIPAVRVDGNDLVAVFEAVGEAVARARRGEGPSCVEAVTYRWGGHSMRANLPEYRTKQEELEWMERDPIARVERRLKEMGIGELDLKELRQRVEGELEAAVAYGVESPEPTVEIMEAAVYAPHARVAEPPSRAGREMTFAEALNAALHQEMARDERVFLMGEDVGLIGGIFQVSKGLRDRFGEERVRDTPISEPSFVGMGVGAAVAGMRPVVEIQIWDFIAMTMDQVVNQAAKIRYMLGGRATVPLVIRGPQGGGIRLAAQHSQSLEAWFCHVPGLVVVAPSTPYDAKGLLATAIRDDNPVIFLEHKMLYPTKGELPEGEYLIPLGKADVKREGADVTVVATQMMVQRALQMAGDLEKEGISVEVVDPRTLVPLDEETILASVAKTSRLVIVHEAVKRGGFGAEIAAMVTERGLDLLDAPIVRVAARNVPMPYNDKLEVATIPSRDDIMAAVRSVLA
jgi:2-oxoisovalerate dehydrogenase E1 component